MGLLSRLILTVKTNEIRILGIVCNGKSEYSYKKKSSAQLISAIKIADVLGWIVHGNEVIIYVQ